MIRDSPLGLSLVHFFFERVSDYIRFIMRKEGYTVFNYSDDFIGVSTPSKIGEIYTRLQQLISELGFDISTNKLVPPTTKAVCLGILINTEDFSMSIPTEKLREIQETVKNWQFKKKCTKKQLQSLLGHLLYISKCVKFSRGFLNRMLELLRDNHGKNQVVLNDTFFRDLTWFKKFMNSFNGVSFFALKRDNLTIELDACSTGFGAIYHREVYHIPLPEAYKQVNIAMLEMLNVFVAISVWKLAWRNKQIQVRCDNMAVVHVLRSGKTRDRLLGACARNIFMVCALFNIDLQVSHIAGNDNKIADLLSRWKYSESNIKQLTQLVHPVNWLDIPLNMLYLDYNI